MFKYLLSQIPYAIDEKMLVQWYITYLLENIRVPLHTYDLSTCEEILIKAQQIEMDDKDASTSLVIENRIEEKLVELQQ
jgi:hypothetical protein